MMDSKALANRLKDRSDLNKALNRELAVGLDDGGAVGAGVERFAQRVLSKKRVAAH